MELEADEFAGQILAKLGASLSATKSAFQAWIKDDKVYLEAGIKDYPLPIERLRAVEKGWNRIEAQS